jgi:hypothetical protein
MDALVMQDRETESLWPQPWGECVKGPSEGKKLDQFPAIHTTYAEFKKQYPNGQLLKKPEKGEAGSPYDRYFADPNKLGIFGRVNNFERLPGKDKVFGIRQGNQQVAVAEAYLVERGYATIADLPDPVVITYVENSGTAVAFAFTDEQNEAIKHLKVDSNRITVSDDQLAWDALTGKLIEGNGEDLALVPTMSAYWFAWLSFFPKTELIK